MKQWYASKLYDHSNASIAKALLLQMPDMSFTQYRNELARVLGTRQHVQAKQFPVNPFQLHLKELSLRRKRRLFLNLSISEIRRSVLNLLRLRIFVSNWMEQLLRTLRFGNCLILQHCKLCSLMPCRLHNSGLEENFLVRSAIQLLQQAKMEQRTQTRLAITARIWAIV